MRTQFILILFLIPFFNNLRAQNEKWKIIESSTELMAQIPEEHISQYLDSLAKAGYYTLKIDSINPAHYTYFIHKGKNYSPSTIILDSLANSLSINISALQDDPEQLKNAILTKLETQGYSFATVTSQMRNDTLFIYTNLNSKRKINGFVIESDEKFPKSLNFVLNKTYDGEIYNDALLQEIDEDLEQNSFISLQKPSQVLFLKDSTIIYTYPKKKKQSYFDGIIGFTNNDSEKLKITGNVDLQLGNVFNAFEKIILHWNSAANSSQDFNLNANFPYVGKTLLGSDTRLKIFRQDSTFVNFSLNENLYYHINRRTQLGINGFLESSTYLNSDTLMTSTNFKDFNKSGLGLGYEYSVPSPIVLFRQKFLAKLNSTYIKTKVESEDRKTQYFIGGEFKYLFQLNKRNFLFTRLTYENLLSDGYLNNELFRVGGIYSIRGFNENSILTNQYYIGSIEYRFLPNEELYFSIFSDFGNFQNTLQNASHFLIGLGTGVNFRTSFGLFSLQYALGKFPDRSFQFADSKIHIGIKTLF